MRLATIALAGTLVTAAVADTLSVPLSAVASFNGPAGGQQVSRAVLGIGLPDQLSGAQVDAAFLRLPSLGLTGPGAPLTLRVHLVTSAWQPENVTWACPWQTSGGDFDSLALASAVTWPDDSCSLRFDLTDAVHDWLSGAACNGVILLRPDAEGGGFGSEAQAVAEALEQATVRFYYTRPAE
jgi:hypothetical protein